MSIIWTIIIGFIVGLIARALMPGKNPAGCILTTLIGIGGAFVGKYLGQEMGLYREGDPAGFLMSVLGALIILLFYHLINRNQTPPVQNR